MAKKTPTLIASHNPLPAEARQKIAGELGTLLAAALDLYTHAKMAHWNVRGPDFMALHELFDQVSDEARAHADELAERAGQLGAGVEATLREAAAKSPLTEYELVIAPGADHVERLAKSLGDFSKLLLEAIEKSDEAGDPVTTDVLTTICRAVDKMMWFVESHGTATVKASAQAV
jgi:starvation-inducible DNA-binding protein